MTNSEFDLMWKVLSKYSLKVENESNDEDVCCTICKKLLNNARQSLCGCNYCHKCVVDYSKDGDKVCPGPRLECKQNYLTSDKDFQENLIVNEKISQLKVKCQFCFNRYKLIEMDKHVEECGKRRELSNESQGNGKRSVCSMERVPPTHPRIMMEIINNLKDEVDNLKSESKSNECEILSMKNKLREDEAELSKLRKEIWCILYQLKESKDRIECLERKVENNTNKETINMRELTEDDIEDNKTEESICNDDEEKETNLEQLFINSVSLRRGEHLSEKEAQNNGEHLEEEHLAINKIKTDVKAHVDLTMCWLDQMDIKMCKLEVKVRELRQEWIQGERFEFIWKVKHFSRKKDNGRYEDLRSDCFYTTPSGYKLRLWMYQNEFDCQKYLTIYFKILPGVFDNVLRWPFKDKVTLEVIDQIKVAGHFLYEASYSTTTDTYKYVFQRPGKNGNEGYGFDIKLIDLLKTPGLIVNDTIFVKCSVTPECHL